MEDLHCWQNKFVFCKYSKKLLNKIILLNKQVIEPVDLIEIKKAIYYAKKYHGSQKRDTGEPFYSHPLAVAEAVADYVFDTDVIVASILHDLIEDTSITQNTITKIFNSTVAEIVVKLTRNNPPNDQQSAQQLLLAAYERGDFIVVLIKLLDRIDNLKTIYVKSAEKQLKIKVEILESFFLASFRLDNTINQIFADYLLSQNSFMPTPRQFCFSYGDYQLASPNFQNNF